MKQTFFVAAFLAVGAAAQNLTSTRIEYYNTCTLTAGGIVTATDTQTYCPPCEAAGMTTFPGGSLTTYTTVFSTVCPTGTPHLEGVTYTVTEPCPSTGLDRGSSYVPQGFTVTTVPCSVCESGKSQYVQTTPGPALASALAAPAAAPAVPTPAAGAGNATPPAGAPSAPAGAASPANAENAAAAPAPSGTASPANAESAAAAPAENGAASPANAGNAAAAPAENGAAAPAGSSAGAAAPYPVPSQAGQVAAANGAPASNGNSTVPFKGGANLVSALGLSSFITALATLMAWFAFAL